MMSCLAIRRITGWKMSGAALGRQIRRDDIGCIVSYYTPVGKTIENHKICKSFKTPNQMRTGWREPPSRGKHSIMHVQEQHAYGLTGAPEGKLSRCVCAKVAKVTRITKVAKVTKVIPLRFHWNSSSIGYAQAKVISSYPGLPGSWLSRGTPARSAKTLVTFWNMQTLVLGRFVMRIHWSCLRNVMKS